jgi:transcriptional regulator with XRE-family HTH domain
MDDRRVGLVIRALRRRRGWRQVDLSRAANVSQSEVSRAERGHLENVSLTSLRKILGALDARVTFDVRWRGGELDRVVDARHALLVARARDALASSRWQVLQELTYAVYGERGSIDLVGVREQSRVAVVMEIKGDLVSWEETQRRFDTKVRLLPGILQERLGWRPRVVGAVIVLDESMTNRRRIDALGRAAVQVYPAGGREVRKWLKQPDGPLRGLWFLSSSRAQNGSERRGGSHRVRRPSRRTSQPRPSLDDLAIRGPKGPNAESTLTTSPNVTG